VAKRERVSLGWSASWSSALEGWACGTPSDGWVELDGGEIPFSALVDMFRALAAEGDEAELARLTGPARGEIGRLAPELDDGPDALGSGDSDPSRIRS
jgi:hypothetical protein